MSMKRILITGAAGFIGAKLAKALVEDHEVIGFDNLNDYYDVRLKESRLATLKESPSFTFIKGDLRDQKALEELFLKYKPHTVINLAAQAGVRHSIDNPQAYIDSNIVGFFNVLEACRNHLVEHLVFASSSSIYGANKKVPYATDDKTDHPVSLYAATKKSNELMAYAYAKLYDIPVTGLRFFTVYGPAGRPDMAYFKFTNQLVEGEKIQIYNYGDMYRDFTYIDDIVEGVVRVVKKAPQANEEGVKYKLYNIGSNHPISLMDFVNTLEQKLIKHGVIDKVAEKELLPMQPGDVYQTYADISDLERDFGFKPRTSLDEGLEAFVKWYKEQVDS
ncbi:MAG TPA: NAD-dependent epimerase [Clostridiales bacterium]|nr:NAD-dependent epimerase [Clostridiales bacterium]